MIIKGVSGDLIIQIIAGSIPCDIACKLQILDIVRKCVTRKPRNDNVSSRIWPCAFNHLVADIVDIIHVVAIATIHGVGAKAAIKTVIFGIAIEGIVELVTGCIEGPARCSGVRLQ